MKGWGAQDDFQEQIAATVNDRLAYSRYLLSRAGSKDCEDCDNEIPVARRKAIPSTTRCVKCQEAVERA